MNNYWFTNYKAAQGGKLDFRFALTSGKSVPTAEVARFGRDWSAAERRTIRKMISAEPDNVFVSAFKRSEDGKGYIARLREMSGKATRATLHVPALAGAKDAFLATGVEDVVKELSLQNHAVAVDLGPWDVVTVRIE
jgi:alpha-mannosidase